MPRVRRLRRFHLERHDDDGRWREPELGEVFTFEREIDRLAEVLRGFLE